MSLFITITLAALLAWAIAGLTTVSVLLVFIVKQYLKDRSSCDFEDDARLLLVGFLIGFVLLPLMIAAPISGYLANFRKIR